MNNADYYILTEDCKTENLIFCKGNVFQKNILDSFGIDEKRYKKIK